MLSKNHPIILFIDRNGFGVYQDVLTNIPRFNFTPDLVTNLDVINKEQFSGLIATFIQINKIVPSSLGVILSDDVICVKDLTIPAQKPVPNQNPKADSTDDKEHRDEVQSFLENVPFEEILAKVIKTGTVNRIVAVNKNLVMAIIDAFTSKGSVVEAITPSFMYGQAINFTAGLTSDNVRAIFGNLEPLRIGNLLTDQEKMISPPNLGGELIIPSANETKKPRNLRQYILIGIFVVSVIILVVVYLTLGVSQAPPQSPQAENTSAKPVSTQIVSPTAPITTMSADLESIQIKITQSSQVNDKAKAANLKSELLKMGFQNITDEVSGVLTPEKSSVIFSQDIPADLRNNIIAEVKKILPGTSILEDQELNSMINIIIGKS